jgi:hypothetical protein
MIEGVAVVEQHGACLGRACSPVRALMLAFGLALASACGGLEPQSPQDGAGAAGAGGGSSAGGGAQSTECPALPIVLPSQSARLSLKLPLEVGGMPLALGQATTDGQGGSYKLSFLAYYLTDFRLIDAAGVPHAATLLGADDVPLGYGLRLVNVDDPSTEQLRLAVEPGLYGALRFSIGVPDACNALDLTTCGYPLSFETEMNWGWTMLNLRLEGSYVSGASTYTLEYHVGFPEEYRMVELPAALDLSQGPLERTLAFEVDKLLGIAQAASVPPYDQVVDNLDAPGTFVLR